MLIFIDFQWFSLNFIDFYNSYFLLHFCWCVTNSQMGKQTDNACYWDFRDFMALIFINFHTFKLRFCTCVTNWWMDGRMNIVSCKIICDLIIHEVRVWDIWFLYPPEADLWETMFISRSVSSSVFNYFGVTYWCASRRIHSFYSLKTKSLKTWGSDLVKK